MRPTDCYQNSGFDICSHQPRVIIISYINYCTLYLLVFNVTYGYQRKLPRHLKNWRKKPMENDCEWLCFKMRNKRKKNNFSFNLLNTLCGARIRWILLLLNAIQMTESIKMPTILLDAITNAVQIQFFFNEFKDLLLDGYPFSIESLIDKLNLILTLFMYTIDTDSNVKYFNQLCTSIKLLRVFIWMEKLQKTDDSCCPWRMDEKKNP